MVQNNSGRSFWSQENLDIMNFKLPQSRHIPKAYTAGLAPVIILTAAQTDEKHHNLDLYSNALYESVINTIIWPNNQSIW